ncbi:autophagy-related protein 18f-like protein [Carex littledalei]|uniref:Autophagy-related protein 18f-like protein n=1 Tax=Carex littledalei TaxID=544730 RepID=A0A833VBV4_9POAL|nr:autophagy-related protein 18f-like protein [Carex littledalei]
MRNDEARGRNGSNRGLLSAKSFSSYVRIVSSGASTVASTIRSAGASIVSSIANAAEDSTRDQVRWAGFDKLELDPNSYRQVLLLGYQSGFQVWDVEQSGEVRQLASRHDGPVSFLQVQKNPNPNLSNETIDQFADARPLLIVACDGTSSAGNFDEGYDGSQDFASEDGLFPTFVRFYSFKLHDYVHELKFRSAVYSVRCSPRVVAVSQATQIHCFNSATLEREYTILTLPISSTVAGPVGIGYGPLAVGPRWLAYTGSPVTVSDAGRVSPQILNPPSSGTSVGTGIGSGSVPNGSLVAHYAKESSRQLAAGIVILGDMGYQKISEYLPRNGRGSNGMNGNSLPRANGQNIGIHADNENAGMVIVRDIVSKQVIVQFRAHTSPISALCFDPSGTLLVTASIHGRNINVFRIMPPAPNSESDACGTYLHLYRLQRGITNAVIKDISFSDDSEWIMISSSRGTSHLFAISPYCSTSYLNDPNQSDNNSLIIDNIATASPFRGPHVSTSPSLHRKSLSSPGPPVTLSVISRIRNGSNGLNGLKGAVSLATGGPTNSISGAVASAFYKNTTSSTAKDYLLVFSPSGSIIQYFPHRIEYSENGSENRFVVEALQKWDMCHKKNRQDHGEIFDIYGEQEKGGNGNNMYNGLVKSNGSRKFGNEESRNLYYISEVELQTHIVEVPLWARSGIFFQAMSEKGLEASDEGEIEIEQLPTRTIEARSRDLIPVFDSLQMIRFHHSRANAHGPLVRQKSAMSEEGIGRLSQQSSCSSMDYSYSENGGNSVHNRNSGSQTVAVNSNGGDTMSEARLQLVNNDVVEASDLHIPDLL